MRNLGVKIGNYKDLISSTRDYLHNEDEMGNYDEDDFKQKSCLPIFIMSPKDPLVFLLSVSEFARIQLVE